MNIIRLLLALLCAIHIAHTDAETEKIDASLESAIAQNIAASPEQEKATLIGNIQEKANIYLNYENASLRGIFEDLANRKQVNYEPIENLDDIKVSISTRSPLTLTEAWDVLNTLLRVNNLAMVEAKGLTRIVRLEDASGEPLATYINMEPEKLPNTEEPIRYLYFFSNIANDKVTAILTALLGNNAKVSPLSDLNACLLSGPSIHLKQAVSLINDLDLVGLRESIQVIQLKHIESKDLIEKLRVMLNLRDPNDTSPMRFLMRPKQEASYFSQATRIIDDPRTNKIILLGTYDNLEKIKHFIQNHFDLPLIAPRSRLHIKELKYVNAEDMQDMLEKLIPADGEEAQNGKRFFKDVVIMAEENNEAYQQQSTAAAKSPSSKSPQVQPVNLAAGNRLLIACNDTDWKRLEKFIDKLDKPLPTVAIEVMFVEASIDSQRALSAQWRNKKDGTIGRHVNMQTQNMFPEQPTTNPPTNLRTDMIQPVYDSVQAAINSKVAPYFQGSNFTIGCVDNIWAALKVVFGSEQFNIVSQPFLVGNNNQKCSLALVDTHLVAGNVVTDNVTASVPLVPFTAKIDVNIIPKVNLQGDINLNMVIDISRFSATTTNQTEDVDQRRVMTLSTMHNGEVLVVGGLLQRETEDDVNKTPILGDIPIIGNLFRGETRAVSIKNLYIFIRPTIVKPNFEARPDDYTQLKLDYANINLARATDISPNDPIQRWFFNTAPGEPAPEQVVVNNFVSGRSQPQEVNIIQDPYYKASSSRTIEARKKAIANRKKQLELKRRRQKRAQILARRAKEKAAQPE